MAEFEEWAEGGAQAAVLFNSEKDSWWNLLQEDSFADHPCWCH